MDDYTNGDFLFLAHVKRFYHLGIPIESFAYPCVYRIGSNAVWVNADDLVDFRNDGAVWEKSAFYRNAEILQENRDSFRPAFSMERDCFFHRIAECVDCLPKGGLAGVFDCSDGVFVYSFAVFLQQALHGGGNKED